MAGTKVYLDDVLIGETGDMTMVERDVEGGYRRSAEVVIVNAGYNDRVFLPLQFFGHAGIEPRKPWVRDKDWEQRAPRRRGRR